jgi:hypothetical protein
MEGQPGLKRIHEFDPVRDLKNGKTAAAIKRNKEYSTNSTYN